MHARELMLQTSQELAQYLDVKIKLARAGSLSRRNLLKVPEQPVQVSCMRLHSDIAKYCCSYQQAKCQQLWQLVIAAI